MNAITAPVREFPKLREEFPDFDVATLPAIPGGLVDTSWRNDSCPVFELMRGDLSFLAVYVDFADPQAREFPEMERFSIHRMDGEDSLCVLTTDEWSSVEVALVAEVFAAIMKEWLLPAQMIEVRRRNLLGLAREGSPVCASHDYCDANMAMDQAFQAVFARCPLMHDGSPDSLLLDRAWEMARAEHLTAR